MTLNNTNTNFETLETIAADSIAKLETSNRPDAKRWINAIRKGCAELLENPFWNYANGEFVIMSTTSNTTYTPNGVCSCRAFTSGNPCRHRSQKRLLDLYAQSATV